MAGSVLTAGTTRTQAGATQITADVTTVNTSTAPAAGSLLGDGVALPLVGSGTDRVFLINNTANPIQVYAAVPASGTADTINGVAGATGIAMAPGAADVFIEASPGAWQVESGVGTSGQLATMLALDAISAAGSTQATATALTADFNRVTTATANQGVKLPASASGLDVFVLNHSGANITVYGAGTDKIDDVASATGVTQMNNSVVLYTCYGAGNWYSEGLATGYAGNGLQTIQFADSISAAGTTQATATALTAALNNVTTVASGTGVNLPASSAGLQITVQNNGANPLTVYPAQGASDTINGQAAATGVQILPGTVATFNCTTAGAWTVQPGSTTTTAYNAANNAASFTATAAQVTGGTTIVELDLTGNPAGAANVTLPTVAALVAALHTPAVGSSFVLRVKNSANTGTWTVVTNTGWTLNGTVTVATNTWRDFQVKLTSLSAATLQNLGAGVSP